MNQTTIIVREENGNCQILLEKGARNGTRTMQRIKQIKNTQQFGNIMRMFGM